jgi:pimeloyl-ACP methyl ester carboxylesterase
MRLHLRQWGDPESPAVVCVHGLTSYGGHFRRLAEERLARRFHVLAPDLRGHGHSAPEPPWDLATQVEDVLETVDENPRLWLGHSFGGRLVLELAAARPELVERAVLLDPALRNRPEYSLRLAETARTDDAIPPAVRSRVFRPLAGLVEEEVRDGVYGFCRSAVVAGFGELARRPPAYERVRCPTLIVLGRDESAVGPNRLRAFQDGMGDRLQTVFVPGGHTVLWDAFVETAAAVERFLA